MPTKWYDSRQITPLPGGAVEGEPVSVRQRREARRISAPRGAGDGQGGDRPEGGESEEQAGRSHRPTAFSMASAAASQCPHTGEPCAQSVSHEGIGLPSQVLPPAWAL